MPGPERFSPLLRKPSTSEPITRDRNTTKVFITPWISVIVTMSPLAMCATSWPITASTSSRVMPCSRPVETAISALFLKAPVEGVRLALEDAHCGHADAGLVCELANRVHDPGFVGALGAGDHLHAGAP